MLKVLTRKEWLISHFFIILGLVFISSGIYLNYNPIFPAYIPLVGGIWTLAGGICFATVFLVRKK